MKWLASFSNTLALLVASGALAADPAPATTPKARVVEVPGTVEAFAQADLYSMVSGYVTDVKADIGDSVTAGKVLAVIAQPEREQDLLEAQAIVKSREASLQATEAAIAQSRAALDTAKRQLERYRAESSLRETTLRRKQELFEGKAITDQELDEARTASHVARADVEVAQSKIAAAEADLASVTAARAVAEAQVKVAQAAVEKIKTWIKYGEITAPFDGVITRRMVDPGTLAQASTTSRTTPLLTIHKIDQVRVFIELPEADAALVKVGDVARVKPYGLRGEVIEGSVTRLATALSPATRTMRVEIDLPNPQKKLVHGMYANVSVEIGGK